jgi:hypothetical protein
MVRTEHCVTRRVNADGVGNSIEGDVSSKDGCAAIAQSVAKHENKASEVSQINFVL